MHVVPSRTEMTAPLAVTRLPAVSMCRVSKTTYLGDMLDQGELQAVRRRTSALFNDTVDGWYEFQHPHRDRSWLLLNGLAHALNGEEAAYFSAIIHDAEAGDIEVVAYATEHLTYFRGALGASDPCFRIVPRSSLSVLEVPSAPQVITAPGLGYFSSSSYQVSYGDDLSFSLPLSARSGGTPGLDEFARSLWKDLVK